MKSQFIALLILLVSIGSVLSIFKKSLGNPKKASGTVGRYRKKKILTDNEAEFFGRLVAALPEYYIFPQVAMSALLEASSSDKKTAYSDRLKIAQHRVDYVICSRQCEIVAVVELDDRTHSEAKDQVRDSRLQQAGIRTVRFQSKSKPNKESLRSSILLSDDEAIKFGHAAVIASPSQAGLPEALNRLESRRVEKVS